MEDKTMLPTIVRRRTNTVPNIFSDLFNDSYLPRYFNWDTSPSNTGVPAVNVEETDKEYLIEVAAPGLDKKDLKVSVNDGLLTISSEIKTENEEKKDNYIRREFGYTSFSRSFTLPEDTNADKINASHKNGVLTVTLPKAEAKAIPVKEIKIS